MKITKILILTSLISINAVFAQENSVTDGKQTTAKAYLELPRIEVVPIKDTKTDRKYELYIKLPEGYSENKDKKYPVLYYTDAMWHVEILSGSTENIMKDAILVGISWQKDISEDLMEKYGEHASRFFDYSFWKTTNPKHPLLEFGQADNHLAFIRNDVFNYIEQNYRVNPNDRSYFGYSLSGVFGAYILVTQPGTFKNFILGSPSVNLLIEGKHKIEFTNKKFNANVFISHGTLEKNLHKPISEFVALLKARNDNSLSIEHVEIEGNHETGFPMTGVRSVTWLSNLIKDGEFPVLKGPYFGQKPPGLIPELFAPNIVSTKEHLETEVLFLPDMTELSFTRSGGKYKKPTLFVMQNKNNIWSRKSIPSTDTNQYKERFSPNVSEIKSFEPFKDIPIVGFSVSSKGTYYFYVLDFDDGGSGHMSYSRLIDGKYEKPQKMGKAINTGKYIAHPFIAPDESYLMWDAEIKGESTPDIYISFRQKDGSWGTAINMGDHINTPLYEQRPKVTPDGKYLFFWKGDVKVREDGSRYAIGSPYWVDAKIIETLRPKQ